MKRPGSGIIETTVGSGITKRQKYTLNGADAQPGDVEEMLSGPPPPAMEFEAWLTWFEDRIEQICLSLKLPGCSDIFVLFDKECLRDWYAGGPEEVALFRNWGPPGEVYRREHRIGQLGGLWAALYLQRWPEQSPPWYLGKQMALASYCRNAIKRKRWFDLAGQALRLGQMDREMQLKFSGEHALRRFETFDRAHTDGTNKGNRTIARKAAAWRNIARELAATDPDVDLDNLAGATRRVFSRWPDGAWMPKQDTISRFLGMLRRT